MPLPHPPSKRCRLKSGLLVLGLTEVHYISTHGPKTNHTIDWSSVQLPIYRITQGIKESTSTRKMGVHAMNHDGGHHQLSQTYSKLLQ